MFFCNAAKIGGIGRDPETGPHHFNQGRRDLCCNSTQNVLIFLWALYERQAVGYTTRKGVLLMRITLHIGPYTVTIIVKRRENRHPAR